MHFTARDIGCWADGALGSTHVREVLANLIEEDNEELAHDLRMPMSDDAWEEEQAISVLQTHTCDGLTWVTEAGDLLLCREE